MRGLTDGLGIKSYVSGFDSLSLERNTTCRERILRVCYAQADKTLLLLTVLSRSGQKPIAPSSYIALLERPLADVWKKLLLSLRLDHIPPEIQVTR